MPEATFKIKINNSYFLKEEFATVDQAKTRALSKRSELTKKTTKGRTFNVSVVKIELIESTVIKNSELEKELAIKEIPKERIAISVKEILNLNELELYFLFKDTFILKKIYSSKVKNLFAYLNKAFLDEGYLSNTFLTMDFPLIIPFCKKDFFVDKFINENFKVNSFYPKFYFSKINETELFSLLNIFSTMTVLIDNVTIKDMFKYFIDNEFDIYNTVRDYGVLLKGKIKKVSNKIETLKQGKSYFIENDKTKEIENDLLRIVCCEKNEALINLMDIDIKDFELKLEQLNTYLDYYNKNNENFQLQIKSIIDKINNLETKMLDKDFSHLEELKSFIDNRFVNGEGILTN